MTSRCIRHTVITRIVAFIALVCASAPAGHALSFSLDSIAEWGKFPRFCIGVYRWGDRFFNTYDSTYVRGTGYKFNVKLINESWIDHYSFNLPNQVRVDMSSDASTSMGAYITYLAVSFGYDINMSNLFRGTTDARSRYRLGFDCALLSVSGYIESNSVGTKIRRFGDDTHLGMPFNGVSINSKGIDLYYFFNHKRYSQSAAFSYSKLQQRSQGSFYAGLSVYSQDYDFDFSSIPAGMFDQLPEWWLDGHYRVKTNNYSVRFGYGYNWVFHRRWTMGVSLSPTIGLRKGYVNSEEETLDVSLLFRGSLSLVWNSGRWFAGLIGKVNTTVINDRKTIFMGNNFTVSASVGYRFNIW